MLLAARRLAAVCSAFAALVATVAQSVAQSAPLLRERHVGVSRDRAATMPRSEADQAVVDGWPLYRTERGQAVFNEAMATLKATETPPPRPEAFKGCAALDCALALPAVDADGWLQAGRIWLAPDRFILVVTSPRQNSFARRTAKHMKVFVFHEFHNSSRNTDVFDTISSHSGPVFTPLYMSKAMTDARGRGFVVLVQVAPLDVMSVHATIFGSAGPGLEVAKNSDETLEELQALAGIVVGAMVTVHAPQLEVVNHRGQEGLAMLERFRAWRRSTIGRAAIELPFQPARAQRLASAIGDLSHLLQRGGVDTPPTSRPVAMAPTGTTTGERRQPVFASRMAPIGVPRTAMPPPMLLAGPRPALRRDDVTPGLTGVPYPAPVPRPTAPRPPRDQ